MPLANSAFGWELQSLHVMQWVRLVVGDGIPEYFARQAASCVLYVPCRPDSEV